MNMCIKRIILVALAILIISLLQAKTVNITVAKPGTLPMIIGNQNKYHIKSLKISGTLNGTDLRFLRDMAGNDYKELPTKGQLKSIDLEHVTFTVGGGFYIRKGTEGNFFTVYPYTIPKYLFRGCNIERIVLPERTDTIATGAFEHSRLLSISLPDNVSIGDWVFNQDSLLEKINFPNFIRGIGQNCFLGCKSLKSITINDITYIPWHCFSDMTNLETCTIKGDLLHIDGSPFHHCPRLRQVTFAGNVLSTGGEYFADDCRQLQSVTFSGNVLQCGFNNARNCPLLKSCNVKGAVIFSTPGNFINSTNGKTTPSIIRSMSEAVNKFNDNDSTNNIMKIIGNDVYYNIACFHSLAGHKQTALHYLTLAIHYGYNDYIHMKEDSDLINIHGEKQFDNLVSEARKTGDKLYILQQTAPYNRTENFYKPFIYEAAADTSLIRIKEYFHLDSIAGNGNEISQIKNIMYWLHDQIRHDGSGGFPDNCPRNAIDLYKACKTQNRGLNCRGLAIVLSELYLSMGWPARFITCQSKAYDTDPDCHVIDIVWSHTLNKWIWMDPTFASYITDEQGLLLHPGEVRQRLIDGRPLILNKDANWNHKQKQTKEYYLDHYMAKNLYLMSSRLWNGFGAESDGAKSINVTLTPKNFWYKWDMTTCNDDYFWQKPADKIN
jgi:hypothetical protein